MEFCEEQDMLREQRKASKQSFNEDREKIRERSQKYTITTEELKLKTSVR